MNYRWLKWTRVTLALFFFLATSLVFLDFRDFLNESTIQAILFLQFVPSLLKFIGTASLIALGFIIILVLTSLFGRVYCSSICPLGILQDFISRAGKKLKFIRRYRFKKNRVLLRNSILVVTILTGFILSILLVNFLDPYSIYGKIASQLFRPLGVWVNNAAANLLESFNIYFLYKKDLHPVHLYNIAIPATMLGVIVYLSGKFGRLYCNTICPVGTLLGWLSKYSLFRIRINETNCTQCGKCMFACKSECISVKEMQVDNSRCVSCFNCLTVCEDSAIDFRMSVPKKQRVPKAVSEGGRKTFLWTILAGIGALVGIKSTRASGGGEEPINKKPTTVPVKKNFAVAPPGSLSIDHFTSVCTACQLCVSQCPTGVLQPSWNQFGLDGMMQPHMDYSSNYCNYECTLCADVCPTGAILSLDTEAKKTVQMGKVEFIKDNCVVYTENTACGSCSEHCPTQAVKMVPYKGSLTIPETDNSICVGCGACEYACPVVPYKAIFVDGNPVHEIAKVPEQEKLEEPSGDEDFPF